MLDPRGDSEREGRTFPVNHKGGVYRVVDPVCTQRVRPSDGFYVSILPNEQPPEKVPESS